MKEAITRNLFKNSLWLFSGKAAGSIFSALQNIILARFLGVYYFGILSLVLAYVDLVNNLIDLRVWETATKYIGSYWSNSDSEKTGAMIKLSLLIDIITGIIAFTITILLAGLAEKLFVKYAFAANLISIYAFSLLIDTANNTSNAILRIFDRYKEIAFISSIQNLLRLLMVITIVLINNDLKWVLTAFVASAFVGFLIRIIIVNKALSDNGLNNWYKSNLRSVVGDSKDILWFLTNTSFAGTLKAAKDNYLGVLLLGYFINQEAAGLYKIAKSSLKLVNRIIDPVYEAIYPELVKIYSLGDLNSFYSLVKETTLKLFKFTIPIILVLFIFTEQILNLVYGKDYVDASNTLRVIAVSALITQLMFWVNPVLLAMGRPGLRTFIQLISIIIYLCLLLILVPDYSHLGAAIALVGYTIARSILSITIIRKIVLN